MAQKYNAVRKNKQFCNVKQASFFRVPDVEFI